METERLWDTTQKFMKVDRKTMFSGFLWVCLHKSWILSTSKHTKWLKQESQFENRRTWSHIEQFFCFGSKMLQTKCWIHVSYDFSQSECQLMLGLYAGRWPKILHYRIIPCLSTLVGSVRYLSTMLKESLFHYIAELYRKILHCWAIPNPNTLLRYTLFYYIAK